MKLEISYRHHDSSDRSKEYIQEKCLRLKKYFDGQIHVTWNISAEHGAKIAHCHLVGNHMDYFGEAEEEGLYEAIDSAIDKVERQIRKHKEKVTSHHVRSHGEGPGQPTSEGSTSRDATDDLDTE